ncbi:MAG TPA: hypothetical protein VK964_12070 [Nocardioidaceae bacterium]|nr:hypothetical protein [Nocardioidaceae bacterium]
MDRLHHEAEIASERFNDIRLRVDRSRKELTTLRRDLRRQQQVADDVREDVAATVVARYQGRAFSSTA